MMAAAGSTKDTNTTQSTSATLLNLLPGEIIQRVLQFLPAEDVAAFQGCSRRCNRLTQLDLLWKPLCIDSFRYWSPRHSRDSLLATPAPDRNWKELGGLRIKINREVKQIIDDVVSHASGRISKISKIAKHREDVKETLRNLLTLPQDQSDGLARVYWARETLATIDRALALEVWQKLRNGEDVPLEHVFGAFDLMIAQPAPLSLEEISSRLDMVADEFKTGHPAYKTQSPRQIALLLVNWLLDRELTGLLGNGVLHEFYRLRNSLISIALCHEDHPSLPIISAVIFTCLARRLGLDAHPIAYPDRVLATVIAPAGQDLDGSPLNDSQSGEEKSSLSVMYIDPFSYGGEITFKSLQDKLRLWGVHRQASRAILSPASTVDLVRRVSANLRACLREWASFEDFRLDSDTPYQKDAHTTTISPQCASYAASWVDLLFPRHEIHTHGSLHQSLALLLRDFEVFFKQDTDLLREYAMPIFGNGPECEHLTHFIRLILEDDNRTSKVYRREGIAKEKVKYYIGQLFRHARYGYTAVIYGWDSRCEADDQWISRMRVDSLADGREQCFYHVIDDTGNPRYVAEENIGVLGCQDLSDDPPDYFMRAGGKWFKRYDRRESRFVNNMLEQYPDD